MAFTLTLLSRCCGLSRSASLACRRSSNFERCRFSRENRVDLSRRSHVVCRLSSWTKVFDEENVKRKSQPKKRETEKIGFRGSLEDEPDFDSRASDPKENLKSVARDTVKVEIKKMPAMQHFFNETKSNKDVRLPSAQLRSMDDVSFDQLDAGVVVVSRSASKERVRGNAAPFAATKEDLRIPVAGGDGGVRNVKNDADSEDGENVDDVTKTKVEWFEVVYDDLVANPCLADDWSLVGDRFSGRGLLDLIWPTVVLGYIAHRTETVAGLLDVGMSLARHVETTLGARHDVARLASCVAICVHQGGDAHHARAFEYYERLCSLTDVLDSTSLALLIGAFAKTCRWRQCLDFLEMSRIAATPVASHYGPILDAALRAGDADLAERLFGEMHAGGIVPPRGVFDSMVDLGMTLTLLKTLSRFGWIPSASLAVRARQFFESLNPAQVWKGQVTKVDSRGACRSCSAEIHRLPTLNDADFERLRDSFMTRALVKRDVFLNTSPQEVADFRDFLARSPRFDVIVDGLNVAHKTHQRATTREKDQILSIVIDYFTKKNLNVLVLARSHMKRWKSTKLCENSATGSLEWFYTDNISADDPFMLYAALHSGQSCVIVTNDEMRDHRFLLGTELAKTLKIWQRGHQVMFLGLNRKSGQPMVKWPDKHDTRVQEGSNGGVWHIPFEDETDSGRTSFQMPNNWICLRRT